jgi:ribose transport system substrate-binding protein
VTVALLMIALCAAAIAGCGSSSSSSSSSTAAAAAATTSSGATSSGATSSGATTSTGASSKAACGVVPTKPLPAGSTPILAKLPATVRSLYTGFEAPVLASQWANWKPKHSGKLTIGVSFNALINPFNAELYQLITGELKSDPAVGKVVAYTASSPTDISGQLQQFQSLIQQHVDLIVTLVPATGPFTPAIEQAGKAGIPTISLVNYVSTPAGVGIAPNTWSNVASPAAAIIKAIGEKGDVLLVHGITATTTDAATFADFNELLGACPNIKIAGSTEGMYNPPVVKSGVLQFLSTHPAPINAVFQTATMAPAILQAFQQAGRTIPSVIDLGAQVGSLAYWKENLAKGYKGAGTAAGPKSIGAEAIQVINRMIAGQGPKLNNIIWPQPNVTAANLSQFVPAGATPTTQGSAENPPSTYITSQQLDALFNHPNAKAAG